MRAFFSSFVSIRDAKASLSSQRSARRLRGPNHMVLGGYFMKCPSSLRQRNDTYRISPPAW